MSQTLLMFSLMLQPLLIQYVSNGLTRLRLVDIRKLLHTIGKYIRKMYETIEN